MTMSLASVPLMLWMLLMMLILSPSETQAQGRSCVTPDRSQGRCIPFSTCLSLQGVSHFGTLFRYRCHQRIQFLVCCPQQFTPVHPVDLSPPVGTTPNSEQLSRLPSVVGIGGASLLPDKCGHQGPIDHIVEGKTAPIGFWPWVVILRGHVRGGNITWYCGGTLISDRYVLTAAHCVEEAQVVSLEFARIGEHTLFQNPDCTRHGLCAPPHQDISVERIIMHASYNKGCMFCNDIALLRLSRRANIDGNFVLPICLPQNPKEDMGYSVEEFQGKVAWAAGWGSISRDPNRRVRVAALQHTQLTIQNLPFCDEKKENYPDGSMVLCAGGNGRDTCEGDSGGPLILSNNGGTRYFLVGITSAGPRKCGKRSTQGLYTSVHYYMPWILNNLQP